MFHRGIAYAVTSENTIDAIPYGRADVSPFTIQLADVDQPEVTPPNRIGFTQYARLVTTTGGDMLVNLDAGNVPQYLNIMSLNGNGKPARNSVSGKLGKLIKFDETTFIGSIFGTYKSGEQFFTTIGRQYLANGKETGVLLGELGRITEAGIVETSLPNVSTRGLFTFNNATYAISSSSAFDYFLHKSSDEGRTWANLYKIDTKWGPSFGFSLIDKRLVSYKLYAYEFDVESNRVRKLSMAGTSNFRGDITGIAQYDGNVYLSTASGGVYVKPVSKFWQYETEK